MSLLWGKRHARRRLTDASLYDDAIDRYDDGPPPRSLMSCRTKRAYDSRMQAESVGRTILNQWKLGRNMGYPRPPSHVYRCHICSYWHLTSQPDPFFSQTYPIRPEHTP